MEIQTVLNMEISAEKTKLMTNNTSGINTNIKVNGQKLEKVTSFKYLGSVIVPGLTAELQRRIQAIEMRCNCKILRIAYKDHVTNEEVRAKIQQAVGPHEDLLTIVQRRKLEWYGHVSRIA